MKTSIQFALSVLTAMSLTTAAQAIDTIETPNRHEVSVRQAYRCHDSVADNTLSVSITETAIKNRFKVVTGHNDFMGQFHVGQSFTSRGLRKGDLLLIKNHDDSVQVIIDVTKIGEHDSGFIRMSDPIDSTFTIESKVFCDFGLQLLN